MAEVLASLQAPPDSSEFAGWNEALTAYLAPAGLPPAPCRVRSRRSRMITPKLATAGAAAAVAALGGGIAAAAYTGSLPTGPRQIPHGTITAPGVPASHPVPATNGPGHPAGPTAGGSAAYGLCNAYQHAQAHGNAAQRAVAFRNLAKAAGGAGQVAGYCAEVSHPGNATPPGHQASSTGHGKPTTAPSHGNKGGNGHGKGKES